LARGGEGRSVGEMGRWLSSELLSGSSRKRLVMCVG
jgi:hypothetical protein